MKALLSTLSKIAWYIPFIGIVILIAWTNYRPGTFLTGWDNLHPEFDLLLNIKRSVFAVWQEYQGLGLLGGMGHAADLPRQLLLLILSPIVPMSMQRYVFHFLMLLVGSVGMFVFLKDIVLDHVDKSLRNKAALVGGLFYLLNLGTIQYFFVPFEPFSAFWGIFPWEIWSLFQYLRNPSKRTLIQLALINLAGVPQAFVQTVFYVYLLCVGLIVAMHLKIHRTREVFIQGLTIFAVIFCINAFWLFPNLYWLKTNRSVPQEAMINKMSTEETFARSQYFGTLSNFALLRNKPWEYIDWSQGPEQETFMMEKWHAYLGNPMYILIGYAFFGIVLVGLFSKTPYRGYLLAIFSLSAVALLSQTIVFEQINWIIRSVPIIHQVFRDPFTKFFVPTIFIFSVGFSLGISKVIYMLSKGRYQFMVTFATVIASGLLVIYVFPLFQGQLFADGLRVEIPTEYFDLFKYFKTKDSHSRIMNLPQDDFWGWTFSKWGGRGSGILWYGIEQPILDRAFDVWSAETETYYWQLSLALKENDKAAFNSIIEKYDIDYILFDNNVVFPSNIASDETINAQKKFLAGNMKLTIDKTLNGIVVYKTNRKEKDTKNIGVAQSILHAGVPPMYISDDRAYATGDYVGRVGERFMYPFASLSLNRSIENPDITITEDKDAITLEKTVQTPALTIPSYTQSEKSLPVRISAKQTGTSLVLRFTASVPTFYINNQQIGEKAYVRELTVPITSTLAPKLILSINNRDFVRINTLGSDYKEFGSTYLSVGESNAIKLFDLEEENALTLKAKNFREAVSCGPTVGESWVSTSKINGSLDLQGKNTALCSSYEGLFMVDTPTLLEVEVPYRSTTDEFPQFCLSRQENTCLNRKDDIKYGFASDTSVAKDFFEIQPSTIGVGVGVILDGIRDGDIDAIKQISYGDMTIKSYPLIQQLDVVIPSTAIASQTIDIHSKDTVVLKVKMPKLTTNASFTTPVAKNIYTKTLSVYEELIKGSYNLKEEKEDNHTFLRMTSKNSSPRMTFKTPELSARQGYLIGINSRNKKGIPLSVSILSNREGKNYHYSYVTKNKDFQTQYFTVPSGEQFEGSLTLLFGSPSYGNEETVNDLNDLNIYPIPYEYLTIIAYQQEKPTNELSSIKLEDVKKYNFSSYDMKVSGGSDGIVRLSQSFHSGWNAYTLPGNSPIPSIFAPIIAHKLSGHVVVNGWSNGWEVNDATCASSTGCRVVLVFLPQYLEYVGFALFIAALLYSLRYKTETTKIKERSIL